MEQVYTILLSSVLCGCGPVVTETPIRPPAAPKAVKVASLADLAAETYQKVTDLPDKYFPAPSGEDLNAVNYGTFMWFIHADEQGLKYILGHQQLPVLVAVNDADRDGKADRALECLKIESLPCQEYDLGAAQVLYEKMLRDTPAAMAGKKVTADREFSTAYIAGLSEPSRNELRRIEQD